MNQREWLKAYIRSAFAGVSLEDGVDIHTAQYMDSYGCDADEFRLAAGCQRGNWECVDPQILRDRAWVLPFLDAQGFRFYLPIIMIDIIDNGTASVLAETLFYNFNVTPDGKIKDQSFSALLNRSQRAAIVRFLKYLRYNRGWLPNSGAGKLLSRIQART